MRPRTNSSRRGGSATAERVPPDRAVRYPDHADGPFYAAAKRALDVGVAGALILLLSPLFAGLMILVPFDSPGGPFFRQARLGRNGRPFFMYKFRTMAAEAPRLREDLVPEGPERLLFKMRRDPRVTRLGRFLRKYSLDELPQLVNVLVGDMSLVGPRPLLLEDFESVEDGSPLYRRWLAMRHTVRPGLSGLWQVSGRNELPFEDLMRLDLRYVEQRGFRLDLRILARTLPAVLRGAY